MSPLAILDKVDEVIASLDASVGHDEELFEIATRHDLPLELLSQLNWHLR